MLLHGMLALKSWVRDIACTIQEVSPWLFLLSVLFSFFSCIIEFRFHGNMLWPTVLERITRFEIKSLGSRFQVCPLHGVWSWQITELSVVSFFSLVNFGLTLLISWGCWQMEVRSCAWKPTANRNCLSGIRHYGLIVVFVIFFFWLVSLLSCDHCTTTSFLDILVPYARTLWSSKTY